MAYGKPTIAIDFDGVIHSYEHGWKDGQIYGTVLPGFFEWASDASRHFNLVVFSSRTATATGRAGVISWLEAHLARWLVANPDWPSWTFNYSSTKPPALITIDDRALTFDGNWKNETWSVGELKKFKPWNSK